MEVSRSNTPLNAANAANPVSAHFDELKKEIEGFLGVFNGWIDERRRCLTDDKEMYLRTLTEERDTVEALKRQYQQLLSKKQQISQAIEEEQKEYKEVQVSNHEFSQQSIQMHSKIDELRMEFQQIQSEVDKEARTVSGKEKNRDQEQSGNKTIIGLFEDVMGIRIESQSGLLLSDL